MTRPYRLRLVVPSDRISADKLTVHSPSGDYKLADGLAFLETIGQRFNRWLAQSGYQLQFYTDAYLTPRTLLDLQTNDDLTTVTDLDGEGISGNKEGILISEGLAAERAADPNHLRLMQVVVGGGGYAGTQVPQQQLILPAGQNIGTGMVGDVSFSPALTGNYDPWAIRQGGGNQQATRNWGSSMSHEMLNSLGLDAYGDRNFGSDSFLPLDADTGLTATLWTPIVHGYQLEPLHEQGFPAIFPDPTNISFAVAANDARQRTATAAIYMGHIQQLRIYNAPFIKRIP